MTTFRFIYIKSSNAQRCNMYRTNYSSAKYYFLIRRNGKYIGPPTQTALKVIMYLLLIMHYYNA